MVAKAWAALKRINRKSGLTTACGLCFNDPTAWI